MLFRSLLKSVKSKPSVAWQSASRLRVEALEDRSVPAVLPDPAGDILPTYTGGQLPGMDVVAHEVAYLEDQGRVVFYGKMAGSVADTQSIGGLYLFGVDRGLGTARFLGPAAPPVIGPNVLWDSIVRVNPNGTGLFNNIVAGVVTPLNPADIAIDGDEFTVSVPLSLMIPSATRPPEEWTYNLWPRNGIGQNVQVSDLAPDDGNAPVQAIGPARVENVAVNDGSDQRSMVNSLTVTFDGPVALGAGAFEVAQQGGGLADLHIAASEVNGRTVAILTFAGPDIVGGSLADGCYTLTVLADRVHDRWGRELDGDGDSSEGGNRVDRFFRLFGDSDGDSDVDGQDRDRFRSAFKTSAGEASYLWYFDFDADGNVDGRDNGEFSRHFGQD